MRTLSPKRDNTLETSPSGTRDFTRRAKTNNIKLDTSERRVAWSAKPGVGLPARVRLPFSLSVHVAEARPGMSQAIVNLEELRRFAARLKQFNNEMIGRLTTLHVRLAGLIQTWRDRKHDKSDHDQGRQDQDT